MSATSDPPGYPCNIEPGHHIQRKLNMRHMRLIALVAAVAALQGCYRVEPATAETPAAYKVNVFTGSMEYCVKNLCYPVTQEQVR